MTREQHLLVCLAEECSEVQKEVMKILRFGLIKKDDKPHVKLSGQEVPPNHESLKREILDLLAIIEMMSDDGDLLSFEAGDESDKAEEAMDAKKIKVKKYMQYAHELGQLEQK